MKVATLRIVGADNEREASVQERNQDIKASSKGQVVLMFEK